MPHDPYDQNEGEKFNKAVERKKFEEGEKLRQLLETETGQEYCFKTLEEGFIFNSTFTGNSKTYFNEGKRETALGLFNDILDLDPIYFSNMCKKFRNK